MLKIYHNNRCGKSRNAFAVLGACGLDFEVIDYLHAPLTAADLRDLLRKLGKKPIEIIRQKETVYKEHFEGKILPDDAWIDAIVQYPILLERPIVVHGEKAWIVRSEEALQTLKKQLG